MLRSTETLGLLLGLVGVVIFGGTLPLTRIAVAELDPWFVTAGRAAVAGLIALIVLVALRRPIPSPRAFLRIAGAALMLVGGFPTFSGFAMKLVPASHGGVVLGVLPLATAVVGAIVSRERPSAAFWASAVLGAAIVVAFSLRDGGGRFEIGDLLLICAVASAAIGYVLSAELARTMPGWEVISWAVLIALPVTLPLAIWTGPPHVASVSLGAWLSFLYLGVMSQYLGFFAWNAGLALGGVARVSQVQLLQTFVTLAVAALLNRERVDVVTWLSAVAVVGVVMLGRRARVKRL
jgi:drug/metabolite transporter (DMT)-like permease